MMKYTIGYVDGHDLKYKTFNCEAANTREALDKFSEETKKHGDFDDRITTVSAEDENGNAVDGCDLCTYVKAGVRTGKKIKACEYYCTNENSPKFGEEAKGGCGGFRKFTAKPDMSFKDALETLLLYPKGAYPAQMWRYGEDDELERPVYYVSFDSNGQMNEYLEAHMRCTEELIVMKDAAGDFTDGKPPYVDKRAKKKLLDLLQDISYAFDAYSEDPEDDGEFWQSWSAMQKYLEECREARD